MKKIILSIIACGFNKKTTSFFVIMMLCVCSNVLAATYYSKASGTANNTATWGQNTDGTGTAPTNFTTSGDLFILRSASALSMNSTLFGGTWTISSGVTLQVDGTLELSAALFATTTVTISGMVVFTNTSSTQVTTSTFLGTIDFVIASGATLKTANVNGIAGTNCSLPTSVATLNNSATYEFNGTSAQVTLGLPSSTTTILKINNAAGVTLSSARTLSTLTIGDVTSNSIFNDGGFQVTCAGTLNLTSGTFKLGSAGVATTFPAFTTRNISSGTTVEYASGTAQTVSVTPTYQNLVFSGSGIKTIVSGTLAIASNWTVGSTTAGNTNNPTINLIGNFTLNSGTFTSTSGIFSVGGIWSNNAVFTDNSGTVALNGSSQQTIGGSSSSTFNNLTISNAAGALLTTDQTVNNILSLTGGNFDISNKVLIMGATAPAISGTFSASRMIIADGGGEIRKSATSNATASYTFPIGDNTSSNNGAEYTPISLSVTGSAYSSAYVSVSLSDTKQSNNASTTNYLTRYWNVEQSGVTSCAATVVGTYINSSTDIAGTLGSIKAAQLNGVFNQTSNPWVKTGGSVLSGTTLTYTNAAITAGQTSVFTGITDANPTVSITGGNITACYGVNVSLGTSVTGDAMILYSWSPATFLSSTTISNPVVTAPTATTSYTVTIIDGNGIVATSATSTITIVISTWSGSSWDNAPAATNSLVFNGTYSSTSDLSGCSCTVNSGNVVVNSGHTLTITNAVTVSGGTMTFENSASLVQVNNVLNSGSIIYKRNTTAVGKFDYTYWSSPVAGQTLYNVSPTTLSDKYFSWNAVADDWQEEAPVTKVMELGVGYIIRGPQENESFTAVYTASFVGTPNNGDIPINGIIADKSYLIGNPYPSALYADEFLWQNSAVLDGTIYFWTHNTPIAQSGSNYVYADNDYASYNLTGGVGTGIGTIAGSGGGVTPSGKIAAGQSFFGTSKVGVAGGPSIVFNNSMRVLGDNGQFFRLSTKSKSTNTIEKNRIWLNLTNTDGVFKQMLVGYVTGATNDYETTFDGVSFDGSGFADFYSINQDKNLVIQGKALPFETADEIPLGFTVRMPEDFEGAVNKNFTISIDHTDGILANQEALLVDKDKSITHNLSKEGGYAFVTELGTFNDRFVLRYVVKSVDEETLGNPDFDKKDKHVVVSVKNYQLKINSFDEKIEEVLIFDLQGRQIYQKKKVNSNEFSVLNLGSSKQFLIVETVLENGKTVTDKLLFK